MKAVINTSPLIFLAQIDRLEVLRMFNPVLTSAVVMAEVEAGLSKGYQDTLKVRKMVEEGKLRVTRSTAKKSIQGLHPGEASVIALAKKENADIIIVDDRAAIKVAKYLGLNVASTPYLLLKALKEKRISKTEFKASMTKLISVGYFISPDLYLRIMKIAEGM